MVTKELKNHIVCAINDYIVNSADVYERIEKINNPNTHIYVSKDLRTRMEIENLEDEVQDIWNAMKREAFSV